MEIIVQNLDSQNSNGLLFEKLELSFKTQKITTLLGASGSFKTPLLKCICAEDVLEGIQVLVRGEERESLDPFCIGYLPTELDRFFEKERVFEELEWYAGKYEKTAKDIEKVLSFVGLAELKGNFKIRNLQNVEQKFLALACLLLMDVPFLVLDEPTLGMNIRMQKKLDKILFSLKRQGKGLLLATKSSDFALSVSDDVYVIKKGKIIKFGEKYDIFKNSSLLHRANLTVPKTIHFSKIVKRYKNIQIGYRDDVNDLIKDIFRFSTWTRF